MSILSKIRSFNNTLQSAVNGGRFGISQTGGLPATLFSRIDRTTIILIDCSYSMNDTDYRPTRLDAAKNAAVEYVQTLRNQRTEAVVAVISFSDYAKVVVPQTAISHVSLLTNGIRSIKIDAGTNIGNGFKKAVGVLSGVSRQSDQSQIILLTDGFGDCPLSIPEEIKDNYGTVIDIVGIGGSPDDVNEELLRKIATTDPNGICHYRFITDVRTLNQHYRQLAKGLVWKGGPQ